MRLRRALLSAVIALAWFAPAARAQFPQTDIYYLGIRHYGPSGAEVDTVLNMTRRAGYDNQPYLRYAERTWCYYSSIRDDGQADVWRVDITHGRPGTPQRVTTTPEAEYSPREAPDGAGLTVVRVEADSSQRLVRMNLDGSNPTRLLAGVDGLDRIGYYAWLDTTRVALFVLGEPHELWLADVATGDRRKLAADIGRCIRPMPWVDGNTVSYVQKDSTGSRVMRLDVVTGRREPIIAMPDAAVEDYTWLALPTVDRGPAVQLLAPHDGRILFSDCGDGRSTGQPWKPWADLTRWGLTNITRLSWKHQSVQGAPNDATWGLVLVAADSSHVSK
jgi:hypothetical protein